MRIANIYNVILIKIVNAYSNRKFSLFLINYVKRIFVSLPDIKMATFSKV